MDTAILLWIHRHANVAFDVAALFSWLLGTMWFCAPLTLVAVGVHLRRREGREAVAWLLLAISAAVLTELLKAAVGRPRPTLWPWLLPTTGYSFPSGHAIVGAAFYPFLGWLVLRSRDRGGFGYVLGFAIGAFVGVGRMYVGVHWPSDVLAGWAIGLALSLGAIAWLNRSTTLNKPGPPDGPEVNVRR
ncbi:MAG TPA: phosphatase PAP2 family protein [Vicinamibacteria bacterium]